MSEQHESRFQRCGAVDPEREDWKRTLEAAAYRVQIGQWAIDVMNGSIYALRFRSEDIIADLVSSPEVNYSQEDTLCRSYVLRIQRSSKPIPWRTKFAIGQLLPKKLEIHGRVTAVTPLFSPSDEYPEGYP